MMTKKEALIITRDMWAWLAADASRWKGQWPGWKANGGTVPPMANLCSCCAFVRQAMGTGPYCGDSANNGAQHLALCPMVSLWPKGCEIEGPYDIWSESFASRAEKMRAARTISEHAAQLLAAMETETIQPKEAK